jgi:hypothetical protein
MNNCGQIIFDMQLGPRFDDKEMFLYANGRLKQLTDDDVSDFVGRINEDGAAIWLRNLQKAIHTELVLYEDGKVSIFVQHRNGIRSGSINNLPHITWSAARRTRCPKRVDLMLWDGQTRRRISEKIRLISQSSDLNELGDVTWMRTNFCVNPWAGDIRLWSDGATIILPSNKTQVQSSKINNLGDVYFAWWDSDRRHWQPWLYRVSGGGEPVLHRLADDKFWAARGDVNDWGEVAWRSSTPRNIAGRLRLMRRIRTGDSEFDGDIDLVDYAGFADCMTGPGRVDRLCDCRFLDIDHDGDVDLGDFALFQNAFVGK